MFETIFALIGVLCTLYFLYSLGEYFIFKNYYKGLLEQLNDVYYRIGNSEKEVFTNEEVQDIIGLLHNRQYINSGYFEKENK